MNKKPSFRSSAETDIFLLREVLATNPYSGKRPKGWAEVAERFNLATEKCITPRCAREKTDRLLRNFRVEDAAALKRYFFE